MGKSVVARDGEQKKTLFLEGEKRISSVLHCIQTAYNIISNMIWKLS